MENHNKIDLNHAELNLAIDCSNKVIKCIQQSPVLDNQYRLNHIKECQETAIKCYLNIFNTIKDKNYIK